VKTVAQHKYPFWRPLDLARLAELSGARPVRDPADLSTRIWQSQRELRRFIADVYAARAARLGQTRMSQAAQAPRNTPWSRIRETGKKRRSRAKARQEDVAP